MQLTRFQRIVSRHMDLDEVKELCEDKRLSKPITDFVVEQFFMVIANEEQDERQYGRSEADNNAGENGRLALGRCYHQIVFKGLGQVMNVDVNALDEGSEEYKRIKDVCDLFFQE